MFYLVLEFTVFNFDNLSKNQFNKKNLVYIHHDAASIGVFALTTYLLRQSCVLKDIFKT